MANESQKPIELPPEMWRTVQELIARGRYGSVQEAVDAGLKMLVEEEARRAAALDEVRKKIAEGIEEEERGDVLDGDSVMAEWRRLNEEDAKRSRRSA